MTTQVNVFVAYLTKKGWTTEHFAQLAGVSTNTANKWRYGTKPSKFISASMRVKFPDCKFFK